jgi:hypothetical protein
MVRQEPAQGQGGHRRHHLQILANNKLEQREFIITTKIALYLGALRP